MRYCLGVVIPGAVGRNPGRIGSCAHIATTTAVGGGTNIVTWVIDLGAEVGFISGSLDIPIAAATNRSARWKGFMKCVFFDVKNNTAVKGYHGFPIIV